MKSEATVSETLREIILLEDSVKELTQLRDEAFSVFDPLYPLKDFIKILESSWRKLINLGGGTYKKIPYFCMHDYGEIRGIFYDVTQARINRIEFKELLSKSCESIEEAIRKIQSKLSEEEEKLDQLYKEFAQNTGDFQFIFEEEHVKNLIINKLLKS